jgi:glyoxylase-like metal-dependent hydrolase (beta-lactamase superfamily II)
VRRSFSDGGRACAELAGDDLANAELAGDDLARAELARGELCTGRCASRRAVLRGLAGATVCAALGALARVAPAAAAPIAATSVAPGLTLLTGAGGNVLAHATDDGLVLVDSGAAGHTESLREAVRGLVSAGPRVAALFNTHWHLDQVGGNAAFGTAGAAIYAHEKTRLRLTTGYYLRDEDRYEPPLPPAGRPTKSFHTEAATKIGGQAVEYGYLIEAHTDGDIYVAFPGLNVIAAGDVLAPERDPVFDWFGGGWLGGRVDALARLLERSDARTRFVPSYGPVLGRAEVQAEHDLMLELFDRMVEHVRRGETAKDMLETGVLDGLPRKFAEPEKLLYDLHKGFWAQHNKLMPDIV